MAAKPASCACDNTARTAERIQAAVSRRLCLVRSLCHARGDGAADFPEAKSAAEKTQAPSRRSNHESPVLRTAPYSKDGKIDGAAK